MKKADELMNECRSRNLNCSITYQNITDYSVEIYAGYVKTYREVYYTDGHLTSKKAISKALKFITKQ